MELLPADTLTLSAIAKPVTSVVTDGVNCVTTVGSGGVAAGDAPPLLGRADTAAA